jgi:adenylyltransferase/sulfurtransferase
MRELLGPTEGLLMPTIRVPAALRPLTGGAADVVVPAATVRDALAALEARHPGVIAKVLDPAGSVKPFVRIYVGADDIGARAGLDTTLTESDEIAIIPAIAGGAGSPDRTPLRDDQVRRYSRHVMLPDVGPPGQTALLAAAAKIPMRDHEPLAEMIAGSYLAAGGVGALVVPSSTEVQRAELAARGPDTEISLDGDGRDVALAPRPAWWPRCDGDEVALAYWRGSVAATAWMDETVNR